RECATGRSRARAARSWRVAAGRSATRVADRSLRDRSGATSAYALVFQFVVSPGALKARTRNPDTGFERAFWIPGPVLRTVRNDRRESGSIVLLFRLLVRIDHIARLVLRRIEHHLGRKVAEIVDAVAADVLELDQQHPVLRPLALGAERDVADHRLER